MFPNLHLRLFHSVLGNQQTAADTPGKYRLAQKLGRYALGGGHLPTAAMLVNGSVASNIKLDVSFDGWKTKTYTGWGIRFKTHANFSGHLRYVARTFKTGLTFGAQFNNATPVYGTFVANPLFGASFTALHVVPSYGSFASNIKLAVSFSASIARYASFTSGLQFTGSVHALTPTDNAFGAAVKIGASFTATLGIGGVLDSFVIGSRLTAVFVPLTANNRTFVSAFGFTFFVSMWGILQGGVPIPGGYLIPWGIEIGGGGTPIPTAPPPAPLFNYSH
jgi:hypothetical protein